MEALCKGGESQSLTAIALVNPFKQHDYRSGEELACHVSIPYALSMMATHTMHGFVPGVNDLLDGYVKADGTREPSVAEKIVMGKAAVNALMTYRKAKAEGNQTLAQKMLPVIRANMKYFGYGYVENGDQIVPNIPLCFWSFRIMVGMGSFFVLFFAVLSFFCYRKEVSNARWLLILGICSLPMAYIASEAGWVLAEMGRQPWTIQDMLPTWGAVSDVGASSIATTFFLFLGLFTLLLVVEISILIKQIKKGPEYGK